MSKIYLIGVDVGTSSARAALVTSDGKVLQQCTKAIQTWNSEPEYYEQSSEDIWSAVCYCVKSVTRDIPKEEIRGISFDATCSLVTLGDHGAPLSVSKSAQPARNVILWMDHRAHAEAAFINATKHELLSFVGGQVSVEMEMPKLLWLKRHTSATTWSKLWRAFELPDYLTWRSTGCDARSLCSVVCKWNYDAMSMRWNADFLKQIDLAELCQNNFEIIGRNIQDPGQPIANGLTATAADELQLLPGTAVGTSLIDAHAGALAMFGCRAAAAMATDASLQGKLALICGTSTCHMSLTQEPCMAQGVWGPYRGAIIPKFYLNEGGQSATGLLLDHIVKTHPQYERVNAQLKPNEHIYTYLNRLLERMAKEQGYDDICYLTKDLHVWPDYHGNRSPISDPNLRGMICGLNMNTNEQSLALLYLAFVQALAYGTRHIIDTMVQRHKRVDFEMLLFCGGVAKNSVYVQSHADICQLPVLVPNEQEMVLVGAAMLGACAAKTYNTLEEASTAMGGTGVLLKPRAQTQKYHARKYAVFLEMLKHQCAYRSIMSDS